MADNSTSRSTRHRFKKATREMVKSLSAPVSIEEDGAGQGSGVDDSRYQTSDSGGQRRDPRSTQRPRLHHPLVITAKPIRRVRDKRPIPPPWLPRNDRSRTGSSFR